MRPPTSPVARETLTWIERLTVVFMVIGSAGLTIAFILLAVWEVT